MDINKRDAAHNNASQQSGEDSKQKLPYENVDKPAGETGSADEAKNRSSGPSAARQ